MKKKNKDFLKSMPAMHRRELLKKLSLMLGTPMIPTSFTYGLAGLMGDEALAQDASAPLYFLEVNFRDQWDMGAAFVPPSIATNWGNLSKDGDNGIAFFQQPTQAGPLYLTREGMALKDHADTIAVMECGELVIGGIHGHEAGNGIRSPGRTYNAGGGRTDMGTIDKRPGSGGNEVLYSSTPTPAVLHNHVTKKANPDVKNGILLRSSIRANTHTFYHHAASLNNSQLDRFFNKTQFFNHFGGTTAPAQPTDVLSLYRSDLVNLVKQLDTRFLKEIALTGDKSDGHIAALALAAKKEDSTVTKESLQLTGAETTFWTSNIPGQFECPGDNADQCKERDGTMNIGEMFAYAAKLFQSGSVRTVAIDFDFHDIHTARTEAVLTNQGKQMSLSLSRLIKTLKDAGIYDKTVIAMYTLDGSRSPRRNSTGDGSKNAFVLAGGGIKGGYYGDVRIQGNDVFYHRPDGNTGAPVATGSRGKDMRVSNADCFRTVTKAMGIDDAVVDQFPDAKGGKPLAFMLKKA